jgi:hypothetical protein
MVGCDAEKNLEGWIIWPEILNNENTLTSAILDRLPNYAEPVVIDGNSYRMKEKVDA